SRQIARDHQHLMVRSQVAEDFAVPRTSSSTRYHARRALEPKGGHCDVQQTFGYCSHFRRVVDGVDDSGIIGSDPHRTVRRTAVTGGPALVGRAAPQEAPDAWIDRPG